MIWILIEWNLHYVLLSRLQVERKLDFFHFQEGVAGLCVNGPVWCLS